MLKVILSLFICLFMFETSVVEAQRGRPTNRNKDTRNRDRTGETRHRNGEDPTDAFVKPYGNTSLNGGSRRSYLQREMGFGREILRSERPQSPARGQRQEQDGSTKPPRIPLREMVIEPMKFFDGHTKEVMDNNYLAILYAKIRKRITPEDFRRIVEVMSLDVQAAFISKIEIAEWVDVWVDGRKERQPKTEEVIVDTTSGTLSKTLRETGHFIEFSKAVFEAYKGVLADYESPIQDSINERKIMVVERGHTHKELFSIEVMSEGGLLFQFFDKNIINNVLGSNNPMTWTESAEALFESAERASREESENMKIRNIFTGPEHFLLALATAPHIYVSSSISRDVFNLNTSWFGRFWRNEQSKKAVEQVIYDGISRIRPEEMRTGVNIKEYPSGVKPEGTIFDTPKQDGSSGRNIPFTDRITVPKNDSYSSRLNQSTVNQIAVRLQSPEDSSSFVVVGRRGSGRRTLLDQLISKLAEGKTLQREEVRIKIEGQENNNDNNNNTGKKADQIINLQVLSFNSNKIMTEGDTRYVGVVPKNIESFIESVRSELSNNHESIIILSIRDNPLNTLLNMGKTESSDSGAELQNALVSLMRDYRGRLKIIGYTESRELGSFKESNLGGSNFEEIKKADPKIEEIGNVLRFITERKIERSNDIKINSNEKEVIIEGILYLYRTYNTYGLTYFAGLEKNINKLFAEIQVRKQNGELDIITESNLDIIISEQFLDSQPFRRYIGDSRYHDIDSAIEHVSTRFIQDVNLIGSILSGIIFSSKKTGEAPDKDARPKSITFLGGPSGTGKTTLTRAIAEWLFPHLATGTRFFHLNGNNNKGVVTIIGENNPLKPDETTPASSASLTQYVKDNPNALIYVNELHKLGKEVKELLESIFEDGTIEDAKGHIVSFEQTYWIIDFNPVNAKGKVEVTSTEELIEWIKNNNTESFADRLNKNLIYFIDLPPNGLEGIAHRMIEEKRWVVEDNRVYEKIVDDNDGARGIRDDIEMFAYEASRQSVKYADEKGIIPSPSNLRTKLIVEDNEVRIVVESIDEAQTERIIPPENEPPPIFDSFSRR